MRLEVISNCRSSLEKQTQGKPWHHDGGSKIWILGYWTQQSVKTTSRQIHGIFKSKLSGKAEEWEFGGAGSACIRALSS